MAFVMSQPKRLRKCGKNVFFYLWCFCLIILVGVAGFTIRLVYDTMHYDQFWLEELMSVKSSYQCTFVSLNINVDLLKHKYDNSSNCKNVIAIMLLLVASICVSIAEFWSHLSLINKWNNR